MRKGLLISTMLVSVAGFGASADVWAQCATTTCSALGYTSSSNTGDCLKCPFGEAWACPKITCPDNYQYSCSGTGYAGGSEMACNGKYKVCACSSGYIWSNGSCKEDKVEWKQCTGYAGRHCKIGDILFSDGTCAADKVTGKTPIAVVVYISDKGCGQAISLNNVGYYEWGSYNTGISGFVTCISKEKASFDFTSCENTRIIMEAGDSSDYPAAWAANDYSTTGTSTGDWCLPAAGIFTSIYNNMSLINAALGKVSGKTFSTSTYLWSSTYYNSQRGWHSHFNSTYGLSYVNRYADEIVRPVIEF